VQNVAQPGASELKNPVKTQQLMGVRHVDTTGPGVVEKLYQAPTIHNIKTASSPKKNAFLGQRKAYSF
jgi:hypothetical protein